MNVVYQGFFLREGLIRLGHNVIDLSFSDGDDINDKLECVECRIDPVVLELWTLKKIPINLHKCKYTLVAYSIDSPLNEFWFCEMSRIFDHVFVDQKSSVRSLKQKGVQARWLPLCAQTKDFRHAPPKKKYDIMFVGNTSGYRVKRNN